MYTKVWSWDSAIRSAWKNVIRCKPSRKNESEYFELSSHVREAIEVYDSFNTGDSTLDKIKFAALSIREEILKNATIPDSKNLTNAFTPQLCSFFLQTLLFGSSVSEVGVRKEEMDKMVDSTYQILAQNTKSNRQVSYSTSSTFRNTHPSNLSLALPLSIHAMLKDVTKAL